MSTQKVSKREPAEAASQPALRLYEVKHNSCPKRFVEAYTAEEAKRRYREMYALGAVRPVEAEEVD